MGDLRRARDILREMRGGPVTAPAGPPTVDQDPIRRRTMEIVAGVLGLDADGLSPTVAYGQLGGDSLLAIRILSQCRRAFGVELPLGALGPRTALADLIQAVREHAGSVPAVPAPASAPVDDGIPLTPGARALVSLHALDEDRPTYNVAIELTITGPVDRAALRQAIAALVNRHEALRCTFHHRDGELVARLTPVPELDYAEHEATDDADLARAVEQAARIPLRLDTGSVRIRLIRAGTDRHVLLTVVHHAVCDGIAVRVLMRELTALYRGDQLPPVRMGLSDLAATVAARLSGDRRQRMVEYWRTALDAAPELTRPPADRDGPPRPGPSGARVPVTLSATQAGRLRELAGATGGTLFAVLTAGLAVLLRPYVEENDLVIGFPIAGRAEPETLDTVAYLSQTVPLRLRPDDRMSVVDLVGHTHAAVVASYEHADLPFDEIVAAVAPTRTAAHHPLFQVAVVLLPGLDSYEPVPGLTFQRRDVGTGTSKFDLSLYLEECPDGLAGYIEFATDRYSPEFITHLVGQYGTILDGMSAEPGRPIIRLARYTGAEREQLIATYAPEHSGPVEDVVSAVQRFAAERPHQPALWTREGTLTYEWLNRAANRLARVLHRRGVRAEDLVGIGLPRGSQQIVAVLAVLKAGAAYLPLDPAYPPDRLRYMVSDAALRYVIAESTSAPVWSTVDSMPTVIDPAAGTAETDHSDPEIPRHLDGLAYVIYTSGSTGLPKGVQLTHRGLANVVASSGRDFEIDARTRVLQFVSFSFDASVWEIFMALGCGATLCLGPADHADADESIEETIRACAATLVYLPPALLSVVDPARVPSVRLVLTGGDRITPQLRDRWMPHARFFAAYGPTEATIVQTWQECRPGGDGPPPIGRPFANVRLYVLDRWGELVPTGAVGEVCIGGVAVGRGYRGRPGLTADRFTPDPYSPVDGARLYRTGDLVRRDVCGDLYFVGRIDHQVKVRGYRIELGEVEAALRGVPGVADAIVRTETGPTDRAGLVAYIRPAEGRVEPDRAERIREQLRVTLPDYMVPGRIHLIPVFPLTPNGKVDVDLIRALADVSPARLADLLSAVEALEPAEARSDD